MEPSASMNGQPGCFTYDGMCALVVQGTCIAFDHFTKMCTSSQQNFTGVTLTVLNTADLETGEEEVCICKLELTWKFIIFHVCYHLRWHAT